MRVTADVYLLPTPRPRNWTIPPQCLPRGCPILGFRAMLCGDDIRNVHRYYFLRAQWISAAHGNLVIGRDAYPVRRVEMISQLDDALAIEQYRPALPDCLDRPDGFGIVPDC